MTSPTDPSSAADSPLDWTDDGQPRSRLYGDIYFSTTDGLAESRAVFLQGGGLPDAWRGRRRFVVGELGFGTGLNILALLDLWRRERPPGGQLHVFTVEAHPLTADEAARALGRWPELADLAALLVARWPGRARGVHRIDLPEVGAVIDVAVLEVGAALAGWRGAADAWFLDGFSPALNPAMWRDEVLGLVGARSAGGAIAATFTVAGAVRRGLQAAGFAVAKRPGFGRKRERLEARWPGLAIDSPPPRVAVVGSGIAGAAAVRALCALGAEALLVEAEAPGAGASGNPAALVTPRLDAGLGPPAALFAQAFARAVQLYDACPDAVVARGVLQLVQSPRDADRFAKIAASDLFEPDALAPISAEAASGRLGEAAPAALDQRAALVIAPQPILEAWSGDVLRAEVDRLERSDGGWRLLAADGALIAEADQVILAAGPDIARLAPDAELSSVRGQASWVEGVAPAEAAAWGGYAVPTGDGVLFGATHDRGVVSSDFAEADQSRNLATLAAGLPGLAARVQDRPLAGRASIRAATPDRLPIAGEIAPGLHVLGGFGSRGFTMAPLLAEHVAAMVLGAPSPLPIPLAELVAPGRFAERARRRTTPG